MKKPRQRPKSDREKPLAYRRSLLGIREQMPHIDGLDKLGHDAGAALTLITAFRMKASEKTDLVALLHAYNTKADGLTPSSRDRIKKSLDERITTSEQRTALKKYWGYMNDKFLARAMSLMMEGAAERAEENQKQGVATITLRTPPFENWGVWEVREPGLLQLLLCAAQTLMSSFDCSLETALRTCMTDAPPQSVLLCDATVKAVDYIFATYSIKPKVAEIKTKFKELPWPEIRKFLQQLLARDVREELLRNTGIDYGSRPPSTLFPRFCHSEEECKARLTKAALSIARMFINLEPIADGQGGSICWHQRPTAQWFFEYVRVNVSKPTYDQQCQMVDNLFEEICMHT